MFHRTEKKYLRSPEQRFVRQLETGPWLQLLTSWLSYSLCGQIARFAARRVTRLLTVTYKELDDLWVTRSENMT